MKKWEGKQWGKEAEIILFQGCRDHGLLSRELGVSGRVDLAVAVSPKVGELQT